MNLLDLPGVAAFIRGIVRDLDRRRNAFVHVPEVVDLDDLRSGIKQLVRQGDVSLWEELSVDELTKLDPWPVASLVKRYHAEVTGSGSLLVDLCRTASFQGRVIWLEGLGGAAEPVRASWVDTLGQYARQSQIVPPPDRTVFCIPVGADAETGDEISISHHWWWGVVSRVDMMLLVRGFSGDTCLRHPLQQEIIAELAGFDPGLAWTLITSEISSEASLRQVLRGYRESRGWSHELLRDLIVQAERCAMADDEARVQPPRILELAWQKGIINFRPEDGICVHCAALDNERLHLRLWRAQIRAVFPFIDEQRANVCAYLERRHHDLARRWLEGSWGDWSLLEVAELNRLFRSCARLRGDNYRCMRELVEWLYDARNELAHWRVLDPARIEAGLNLAHRAAKYMTSD